jgi:hypothetical protein
MIVLISSDAEDDLVMRYYFYENQSKGLGEYFRDCLISDIDSLVYYAGIHEKEFGYHRALSNRFPYCIYYSFSNDRIIVIAVIDARRDPFLIKHRFEKT